MMLHILRLIEIPGFRQYIRNGVIVIKLYIKAGNTELFFSESCGCERSADVASPYMVTVSLSASLALSCIAYHACEKWSAYERESQRQPDTLLHSV